MNNELKIRLALDGQQAVASGLQSVGTQLQGVGTSAGQAVQGSDSLATALGRVSGYALAGGGMIALVQSARAVGAALFESSASAQRLATQMNFATDGRGAQELAFVSGVANQLGLELKTTAQAYAGFASAARGTALQGTGARDVFEAMSKASAVMGLSADQAGGALLAVQQMMSKGTVSAEEFRGQLGERMPIALQAGAKALGVTTAEFNKMMESGQIVAEDFLPKFAQAMTEMLGDSAQDAANRLDAATARMGNAWGTLKKTIGDSGLSQAMANEADGIASYMTALSDAMQRAKASGAGLAGQLSSGMGYAIARAGFDLVSGSANLLNGTLNMLSGGALGLNTHINLLPDSMRTSAYQTAQLDGKLKEARTSFADLQARAQADPGNIYIKNDMARLSQYIGQLQEAKRQKDALEDRNPTAEGIRASGMARERYLEKRAKDDESMARLQMKVSGVPDGYVKDMTEIIRLHEAGVLVGKDYTDMLAAQQAALLKKTQATGASKPVQDELNKSVERGVKAYADLTAQTGGLNADFADKWKDLSAAFAKGKLTADQLLMSQQALLALQPAIKKAAEDQTRAENEAFDEAMKRQDGENAKAEARIKTGRTMLEQIEVETQLLSLNTTERETATAMRELERQGVVQGTEAWAVYAEKVREAIAGREAIKANIDAAKATTDAWKKTADKIQDSITDSLMRGFEKGKGFAENFRDTVANMFRTLVLRPVIQGVVGGAMGMGASAAGASGLEGLINAGVSKGITSLLGGITVGGSTLAAVGSSIATGFMTTISGGSVSAAASAYTAAGMNGVAGGLSAGATAAGVAGVAGGALVGVYGGRAISGGYAMTGSGNGAVNAGTALGMVLGGPIGAAIGGLIGGAANRLLGRKLTEQGVTGTFGGEAGFTGSGYTFEKGGTFRSDKTRTQDLDPQLQSALSGGYAMLLGSARAMGETLGLATGSLDTFTSAVKLNFKDLKPEEVQAKIAEAFGNVGEQMAKAILGPDTAFAREGETAAATLQRLSGSLTNVNAVLGTLNQTLMAGSLAGADAASQLLEVFGGLENFAAQTSAYYQAIYSESERTAKSTEQLTQSLASMGLALPANVQGYRQLVEAQDLTTQAGRQTYASLIQLSPAFAQVANAAAQAQAAIAQQAQGLQDQLDQLMGNTAALRARERAALDASNRALYDQINALQDQQAAAEAAAQAQQAAAEAAAQAQQAAIEAAWAMVERAADAERQVAQARIDAASQSVATLTAVFDLLKDSVDSLYGQVTSTAMASALAGRDFIDNALLAAQKTGYMPDQQGLSEAIAAVRADMDGRAYASAFEADRDRLVLAGQLSQLKEVGGKQLTSASNMLRLAQSQLAGIEAQVALAKAQIDATQGVNTSVVSLSAALQNLAATQAASRIASNGAAGAAGAAGGASGAMAGLMPAGFISSQGSSGTSLKDLAAALYGSVTTGYDSRKFDTAVNAYGGAQKAFAQLGWDGSRDSAARIAAAYGVTNVPKFAAGGLHSGGLRLVGEKGPELEVTGPARYYDANKTRDMLQGGGTGPDASAEIRSLREELAAQSRALVQSQTRMNRLLERWDGEGMPQERTA